MLEWVTDGRTSGRDTLHLRFEMVGHDKASQSFALYVAEVGAVDSKLGLHPIG
jgi:hypothetical protein